MFSHLKRRIGVLTAVAVLAALVPTLAVSTASAAPATTAVAPADGTTLSACPASASIPSAGFTDTTSTAVDCIAYYGITTGVTATTYEPTSSIPRWQMALYLTRTATEAGVTLGDGSDQGFTDISGKSAEIQTAVNQLKQLGVTNGTTATTYSPDDNVSREQMAMFVERLLGNTAPGPNGNSDDTLTTNISGNTLTYNYTDIDSGAVTYEGHNAIAELYHLGVPGDAKTVTTFSPSADMTRADMATWLTNALGHTNLRPSGLVIQMTEYSGFGALNAAGNELHVSNRDSSFDAVADTIVDIFGFTATTTADEAAFASSGACKDAREISTGTEELCLIENTDYVTNQSGNIEIAGNTVAAFVDVAEGESTQYWAWTAAVGTYYSSSQTSSTATVTSSSGGDYVQLTVDKPYADVNSSTTVLDGFVDPSYDAKMGVDTTVTLQLRSSTGVTSNSVAQAGCVINATAYTGTYAGTPTAISTTTVTTDANGTATYTASKADPDTTADSAATGLVVVFAQNTTSSTAAGCTTTVADFTFGSTGVTADTGGFSDATDSLALRWDDTARAANSVVASAASHYTSASATGSGATNTISATSYDQYGVGIANASLGMLSTDAGVGGATAATYTTTRTTNSSGVATFGVTRDAATAALSTFTVNDESTNYSSGVGVYWVVASDSTALDTSVGATSAPNTLAPISTWSGAAVNDNDVEAQIVRVDTANNSYIVEISYFETTANTTYVKYTWDDNDYFFITGAATTLAGWETDLSGISPTAADDLGGGAGIVSIVSASNPSTFRRP